MWRAAFLTLSFTFALACVSCGGVSMGDPSGSGNSESEDQLEGSLVRVTDLEPAGLSVLSNIGNDPLAQGRVEIEELGENEVKIEVQGAAPNTTYNVSFCPFAGGTSGCFGVTSVMTDNQGNAQVELGFPVMGRFEGVFALTRTPNTQELNEFVTGFRVL